MSYGPGHFYKAKIISITDGDTCRADIQLGFGVTLNNKVIRLAHINTAEMSSGDAKELAQKAKDRLAELIAGKEVILQTMKDRTGKYGRIIGTIFVDGTNVNELLVQEGLAEKLVSKREKAKRQKKKQPTKQKEAKKEKKEEGLSFNLEITEEIKEAAKEEKSEPES